VKVLALAKVDGGIAPATAFEHAVMRACKHEIAAVFSAAFEGLRVQRWLA
jgi:hypothetical protein